jgi:hypothetical protein
VSVSTDVVSVGVSVFSLQFGSVFSLLELEQLARTIVASAIKTGNKNFDFIKTLNLNN